MKALSSGSADESFAKGVVEQAARAAGKVSEAGRELNHARSGNSAVRQQGDVVVEPSHCMSRTVDRPGLKVIVAPSDFSY